MIGVAVNEIELSKIDLFLSKFPMYKRATLPASECLLVKQSLKGGLSTLLAIGTVYPVLDKTLEQLKIVRKHSQILEIYHLTE